MSEQANISARLDALPNKVRMPLKRLLEMGQLDEGSIDTVLDAGELARDTNKLLGFAVGYLFLQSKGVPVKDVVQMARLQRRRLNLEWSANRWRSEHDRLSRAATLERLTGESAQYDVAVFAKHIPAALPGYLIRSSRRLGMEGLRQRHCVASYHQQLQAGYCAIASVFVNRRRWTVQLMPTHREDTPLRIVQIKTRLNEPPSVQEREEIYRCLGIDLERKAHATPEEERRVFTYKENLQRILAVLRDNRIRTVTVRFDGCGDSGSIDSVDYHNGEFDGAPVRLEIVRFTRELDNDRWVSVRVPVDSSLTDAIENVTDEYLEESGVDWYNNDGGYGALEIDVDEGTVSLEVNVRFTESNTEFCERRDIATGEEVEHG